MKLLIDILMMLALLVGVLAMIYVWSDSIAQYRRKRQILKRLRKTSRRVIS